jgi:vancomycin resistance protein YoaR
VSSLLSPPEWVGSDDGDEAATQRGRNGGGPSGGDPGYLRRRRIVRIAALVAFWFAAMLLTFIALGGSKIPDGTVVRGVEIGGLDRQSAINKLTASFEQQAVEPLSVKVLDTTTELEPTALGLSVNIPLTVDSVMTSRANPIDTVRGFLGGGENPLVLSVDRAQLDSKLDALTAQYTRNTQEPEITYVGTTPELTEPVIGAAIDHEAATDTILGNYLRTTDEIELPLAQNPPSVSLEQAQEVLSGVATLAVSAPITVRASEVETVVDPAEIAGALTFQVQDGSLKPVVDGALIHEDLAPELKSVDNPAKDATWDVSGGTPVLVPAQPGNGVTDEHISEAIGSAIGESGEARTVDMKLGPLEPKLTTEAAAALNVTEKISSFKEDFPYAAYRVQNIGGAANKIDQTLLLPGETFSMNDTVGERTKANGFTTGLVVGEGGRFAEDFGGGVSTAATALWTAAFYGGLESVEHGSHLVWISRYQPGLEATVAWGLLDLKFRNNTDSGVFITSKMTNQSIKFTLWGTKQYDKVKAVSGKKENVTDFTKETVTGPNCVPQNGVPGFGIGVDRVMSKEGQDDITERFYTSYIPAAAVTCVGGA